LTTAPLLHIGPKGPVVTTATFAVAASTPSARTSPINSSAVTTTARLARIFSLISS